MQPTPSSTIHFNHLTFPSLSFYRWAGERQAGECDPDHAAGVMLSDILGTDMPRAILIETDGDVAISAWGNDLSTADLKARLRAAIPAVDIMTREISAEHLAGPLNFRLRCSPIRRRGNSEVDAYTSRQTTNPQISRSEVYTGWLNERLAGATVTQLIVARAGGRQIMLPGQKSFMKPAADLEGHLYVTHPETFMEALRRGIGRHGHIGFGTLILSRA